MYKDYFLLDNGQVVPSDIFTVAPELYRIFDVREIRNGYEYRIMFNTHTTKQLDDNFVYKTNTQFEEIYLTGPDHCNWVIMESDDEDGLKLFKRLNNV